MIKYSLICKSRYCSKQKNFDGWFQNIEAFENQKSKGNHEVNNNRGKNVRLRRYCFSIFLMDVNKQAPLVFRRYNFIARRAFVWKTFKK